MNPDKHRRRRRSAIQLAVACVVMIAAIAFAASAHAATPSSHWCRGGDPPLLASAHTSCPFAGATITAYAQAGQARYWRNWVFSPVTHRFYLMSCHKHGRGWTGSVSCTEVGHPDVWTRFSSDI